MVDPQPLLLNNSEPTQFQNTQIAWLDVFRCLSVFVSYLTHSFFLSFFLCFQITNKFYLSLSQLMILVDYGGCIFPIIAHAPWNGIHLADFIMPFFLFIAGISLSLVYKVLPTPTYSCQIKFSNKHSLKPSLFFSSSNVRKDLKEHKLHGKL